MKILSTLRLSLMLVFALLAAAASAQTPASAALPGYWNLETNLITRDYTIVRFYDGQDQLAHEERLDNVCLDLSRRRQRRRISGRLNVALQQVLRDPNSSRTSLLLAQQFKPSQRTPRTFAAR